MALFWFLAGALTTLACLALTLRWLRTRPGFSALPAVPWPAAIAPILIVTAALGLYRTERVAQTSAAGAAKSSADTAIPAGTATAFGTAARLMGETVAGGAGATPKVGAGSMDSAVANLESRLAKSGGSAEDWELLAKSFEFLGRPADAAKARARQLPAPPSESGTPGVAAAGSAGLPAAAAGTGATVTGEISLAPALKPKAAAGETLFIVAKSVDAPGMPVAVIRSAVGNWPLKFSLDDSRSMMPGKNLSSAGRVTIEARISQRGQPLPGPGDLQGTSVAVDPADHKPVKIVIDHEIS